MKGFKFTEQKDGSHLTYHFSGMIDENADLPEIDFTGISKISVQLREVQYINSTGLRRWFNLLWSIHNHDSKIAVLLLNVPAIFMRQMVYTRNFLPKTFFVQSVVTAYYCEACDLASEKLLSRGVDYEYGKSIVLPECLCVDCGKLMKPDDIIMIQGFEAILLQAS